MRPNLAALSMVAGLALVASAEAAASDWARGTSVRSAYGGTRTVPVPIPERMPEAFNYYLRVDVGYGRPAKRGTLSDPGIMIGNGSLSTNYAQTPFRVGGSGVPGDGFTSLTQTSGFDDGFIAGIGAGVYLSPRVRGDLTLDFRDKSTFLRGGTYDYAGWDPVGTPPAATGGRVYGTTLESLRISSTVLMINGYYDLMQRGTFTPYVGVGVGLAYNRMERTVVVGETTYTPPAGPCPVPTGCPPTVSTTGGGANHVGIAAAAMAGFSYAFDHTRAIDVGYRLQYLQSGHVSGQSASDLWEHQLRAGMRWNIW